MKMNKLRAVCVMVMGVVFPAVAVNEVNGGAGKVTFVLL